MEPEPKKHRELQPQLVMPFSIYFNNLGLCLGQFKFKFGVRITALTMIKKKPDGSPLFMSQETYQVDYFANLWTFPPFQAGK